MRPGAVGRVAAIEDDIVRGLESVEPFRRLLGRSLNRARPPSIPCRPARRRGGARSVRCRARPAAARWRRSWARAAGLPARGVLQPLHQNAHQIEHHARMARDQRVEGFGLHAQKFGVAQRHDAAPMAARRKSATSRRPSRRREYARRGGAAPARPRTNTPRIPVMTRNKARVFSPSRLSSVPPGRPNQLASDSSLLQRRIADIGKQRKGAQPLAQRLRIDRLAPGAEGGQKCHVHDRPLPF